MLDSFIGTFDEYGLRTLETEGGKRHCSLIGDRPKFWAVIDRAELAPIKLAMAAGDTRSALKLIVQQARDFGRI